MQIHRIDSSYNNRQNKNHQTNISKSNLISFMAVPKDMGRFYEVNKDIMPATLKAFLEKLPNMHIFSPLQALVLAFIGLTGAKTIQDVKESYPDEELFKELKDINDTKATSGLLGIYRQFKDLYPNGILKSGEDLSVYLLKKIFLEAKPYNAINEDLKNDLIEDVKLEWERQSLRKKAFIAEKKEDGNNTKKNNSKNETSEMEYVQTSTLKGLGIKRPATEFENSIRQTEEEYNKEFRRRCAEGQINRYCTHTSEVTLSNLTAEKSNHTPLTPEQRNERIEKNHKSNNDYFKNLPPERQEQIKALLREGYLKWWNSLPQEEKDRRIKNLVNSWQKLSPEKKTDLINKMRQGEEKHRYAMIDAWNKSEELIIELSKFLSEQQIIKPADMLFTDEGFDEFQSNIMTEFWATHRSLAERFGNTIKSSIAIVKSAIDNGRFDELKTKIKTDRENRKIFLDKYKANKEQKIKEAEKQKVEARIQAEENVDYKKEFREAYRKNLNGDKLLPESYVEDMVDIILDDFPQDIVEKITKVYTTGAKIPDEVAEAIRTQGKKSNKQKADRLQRALEAAISNALYDRGANPAFFSLTADSIIQAYKQTMNKETSSKKRQTQVTNVLKYYDKYKRDLTEGEVIRISDNYFMIDNNENVNKYNEILNDYIRTYGKSALILFNENSAFSEEAKVHFNSKFSALMPEEIKGIITPAFNSRKDIADEKQIKEVGERIYTKFNFFPKEFRLAYIKEASNIIRTFRMSDHPQKDMFSTQSFLEKFRTQYNENGDIHKQYLIIPKHVIRKENKMILLAAEQALADELYNITGDELVYKIALEQLCNFYETFTRTKGNEITSFVDTPEEFTLRLKNKPVQNHIYEGYYEYLNRLQEKADDIFDGDKIVNEEELLSVLYDAKTDSQKELIRKRIQDYI